MGIKTAIEYVDSTANPVTGCTGCRLYHSDMSKNHCFAHRLCHRWAGKNGWPVEFTKPEIFDYRISQALSWPDLSSTKRPDKPWLDDQPRIVFLNDLGDGFCPDIEPDMWLTPYLDEMAASPHVWLFLTKWPHLMIDYFSSQYTGSVPSNFWLGTSVSRKDDTDRIIDLLQADKPYSSLAANYWLSIEPLIEHIRLVDDFCNFLEGFSTEMVCYGDKPVERDYRTSNVDWVVVGGETGSNARPTHPDMVRSIRDECVNSDVPFFFKQWGEWVESDFPTIGATDYRTAYSGFGDDDDDLFTLAKVGKKAAGRTLDGTLWSEMPTFTSRKLF